MPADSEPAIPNGPTETPHDSAALRLLLESRYPDLSAQKRRAADYLLEHHETSFALSVQDVARAAHVSEATVVRLARDLGFGGYLELRAALTAAATRALRPGDRFVFEKPNREPSETVVKVASQEVENINRTVAALDPAQLGTFVERLRGAELIATVGLGVSSMLARLAAYLFFQIGRRAQLLTRDALSLAEQVESLPPNAVLLAIAFPPYSKQTIEAAARARDRGVPVLALTDGLRSPLARLAEASLFARSENVLFTNSLSGAMVVLNALVTDLALGDKERTLAHVAAIDRAAADEVVSN
jgi:DNA-binding MurR/RpiR family transcriptional regulator